MFNLLFVSNRQTYFAIATKRKVVFNFVLKATNLVVVALGVMAPTATLINGAISISTYAQL